LSCGLAGNVNTKRRQNSWLKILCSRALTKILGIFHSKFGMPPVEKNVFSEIANNFYINRFLSCYTII
jgi:hypothetical protein